MIHSFLHVQPQLLQSEEKCFDCWNKDHGWMKPKTYSIGHHKSIHLCCMLEEMIKDYSLAALSLWNWEHTASLPTKCSVLADDAAIRANRPTTRCYYLWMKTIHKNISIDMFSRVRVTTICTHWSRHCCDYRRKIKMKIIRYTKRNENPLQHSLCCCVCWNDWSIRWNKRNDRRTIFPFIIALIGSSNIFGLSLLVEMSSTYSHWAASTQKLFCYWPITHVVHH